MKVVVHHLYDGDTQTFQGSGPHVYQQILEAFPWLISEDAGHHNDVEALVEHLDSMQACAAEIIEDNKLSKSEPNLETGASDGSDVAVDMIGFNPIVNPVFAAARFLSGRPEVSRQLVRQALYDQEDYLDAALQAYQLPVNDEGRRALQAILKIGNFTSSGEGQKPPSGQDIQPGTQDAGETAEAVAGAFKAGDVKAAHLDGKHSQGSLIARDSVRDRVYLLKPGSGGQSPAAGSAEELASPSKREAAFWQVAEDWGLGESVPRCDLIIIDGREYAAIQMLPFSWMGLQKKLNQDPDAARVVFNKYRNMGLLHKWAILDFVLGNPDRHGDNLMISADNRLLALIDHGSAFAGSAFDPAHDRNSFVPFYLRAWAGQRFNRLSTEDKLRFMPTVSGPVREELQAWLDGIHADHLQGVLHRFGIDPQPTLDRLAKVKLMAGSGPLDQVINRLWVTV